MLRDWSVRKGQEIKITFKERQDFHSSCFVHENEENNWTKLILRKCYR